MQIAAIQKQEFNYCFRHLAVVALNPFNCKKTIAPLHEIITERAALATDY
jgi:hypothetical protein